MNDDDVRAAMVRLAAPPQTTRAAVDSIADRMDAQQHRQRRTLVGTAACAVALVTVASVLWRPWGDRSSNAVDHTGEVQIVLASSGAFGVSIEAEMRFSADRLLDSASYSLGDHVIDPSASIMTDENLPEYPHPLPAHAGEVILINGTTDPTCGRPVDEQMSLRVTSLNDDGSTTTETYAVANPEVYAAGVERWCSGTIDAEIVQTTIDPGRSIGVDLLLSNPGPDEEVIRVPGLRATADGTTWTVDRPRMHLGGGAADSIHFFGQGSAVSCDMTGVPWDEGGLTADGVPVNLTGRLCEDVD